MKITIISFTRNGAELSLLVKKQFDSQDVDVCCHTMSRFAVDNMNFEAISPNLGAIIGNAFKENAAIIFIGACGIAVRSLAPFICDKRTDPAVLCLDEEGKFVIPILSGHIGGANRLAKKLAEGLGAIPVITTATDINHRFSVDEWANHHDMHICSMEYAKMVSSQILDNKEVGILSDFEIDGEIPSGLDIMTDHEIGILISYDQNRKPFKTTLNLVPRTVFLGIGCRKNSACQTIEELVIDILSENKISISAIKGVFTIDLKKSEKGLLELCAKYEWPLVFYNSEELNAISGEYPESEFVKRITGVSNVCERAAVLGSGNGKLICGRTARNGVTAALAKVNRGICFDY